MQHTTPEVPLMDGWLPEMANIPTPELGAVTPPSLWDRTWDSVLGKVDPATGIKQEGWGGLALGGAQALGNAWMGMQQYGLAKKQLAQQKKEFETNFAAQRGLVNSQLEDRQRARVASNPGAYQSVSDYMKQNGVR